MTYCQLSDLLLGDLATSSAQDPQKFVQDGTDEIEQCLGLRYVVPFDMTALSYVSQKTIKRINVYLASGRFLVSAFAGDSHPHATGLAYIKLAMDALKGLEQGDYILEGAALTPAYQKVPTGVQISNVDPTSKVEDFYASKALGPRPPLGIYDPLYEFFHLWAE
jgi:hypothetical protein